MLRVAKRHDLWVLCDEAYEETLLRPASRPTRCGERPDIRDRAIAFHTLSKTYGFAGARVGFTHGPKCVMGRRARDADLPHLLRAASRCSSARSERYSRAAPGWNRAESLYRDAGYQAADALGVSGDPKAARFCSST